MRRAFVCLAISLGLLAAAGCRRPEPGAAASGPPPAVLLLACDGATWNILRPAIRRGLCPASARLLAGGTSGELASLPRMISPAIWTSIVTGVAPARHGIEGFLAGSASPLERMNTSQDRRAPALWNMLSRRGRSAASVGWWCSWPAEPVRGAIVSMLAWPYLERRYAQPPGDRPPAELARLCFPAAWHSEVALDNLAPDAIPAAEAAARQLAAEPWYYAKDRSAVDHAARLLARFRPDFLAVYVQGVDIVSHAYWEQAQVVANYYRTADDFWDELLPLADAGTNVLLVSDHGFGSPAEKATRPQPPTPDAGEHGTPHLLRVSLGVHAPLGVLLAAGPRVRRGGRLAGAGVLDVLPTMLPLLDLPAAADMDGQPLAELYEPEFLAGHPIATIESYAEPPAAAAPAPAGGDPAEGLKERLRSIGYVF